jgi:hypothetical protein
MKMKSVVFGLLLAAVSLYTPAYADAVITVQLVNHGVSLGPVSIGYTGPSNATWTASLSSVGGGSPNPYPIDAWEWDAHASTPAGIPFVLVGCGRNAPGPCGAVVHDPISGTGLPSGFTLSAVLDGFICNGPCNGFSLPSLFETITVFGADPGALIGPTPLPGTLPLFATGLGAFGLLSWRRKRKAIA